MRKTAFAFVAASVLLTGCAAYLQYTGDLRIYDKIPNRPLVAVAKFDDARKAKTLGTVSATYRLEPESDVGVALQDQVAKTLHESKFNVVFVDEPRAAKKDLRSILEENEADIAMSGTIRNFQIKAPSGTWFPADVISRLTVTTLIRGEKEAQDHEVLVSASRRMGMVYYLGSKNHGFNQLYRQALEIVAAGIVEDPKVKSELEKTLGGKHT